MLQKAYWVGFNHIKGIGSVRTRKLLDFFGDLSIAWNAPMEALENAGLSEKLAQQVITFRNSTDPNELYMTIIERGIQVVTVEDQGYPKKLKEIDQAPPVLYVIGEILAEDDWAIAIVGTRRMTGYGKQVTSELSQFLAQHGITVVSGLARGIDAVAHYTALQTGGRTLAVLGCGVDVIYPPENRKIYKQIPTQGAIISDYPPETAPEGANFPPRNRIISGLASATVVIEGGRTSGALITSTFAAEQGREVFAVPGNIFAAQSKGPNFLIQQGARPLVDFDEVLELLQFQNIHQHKAARQFLPENEIEAALLNVMSVQPMHVDEIHIKSGIAVSLVSSTLTMLELKGLVYQVSNMNYAVIKENQDTYERGGVDGDR